MKQRRHFHVYHAIKQHLVLFINLIITFLVTAEPEERFLVRTYLIAYNTFLASTWANLFSWTAIHGYLNRGNLSGIHFFTGKPVTLMQVISILEIVHAYFGTK